MPTSLRSNSSGNQKNLVRLLLIPSWPQTILDTALAALVLTLLNIQNIWHYFKNSLLIASQQTSSASNNGWLGRLWSDVSQSRAPQVIFWMIMGCAVYIIIWFIRSFILNLRNDVVASQFIRPKSYSKKSYWLSVVMPKAFLVGSLLVLAAYVYAGSRLLPTLAKFCATAVRNFRPVHSLGETVLVLLATTVSIQVFWILVRITSRAWLLINNEL